MSASGPSGPLVCFVSGFEHYSCNKGVRSNQTGSRSAIESLFICGKKPE